MLRNILTLIPAIAFALPFVAAQPTMARPLAAEATPAQWCWGDDDCFDDDDGDDEEQIQLQMCTQTIIEVSGDDDRAYSCGIQSGPGCLANCTGDAVALTGESTDTCRSHCADGGAVFCSPLKARGLLDDDDDDDHFDNDDDDDDDHGDELVFINTETCLELELNQDGR